MSEIKFEYYVMNYDINAKSVYMMNIFRNDYVYTETLKNVVRYLSGAISYNEFKERVDRVIRHEMQSRRQYEISVSDAFDEDIANYKKYDCYYQVKPNIETICRYVISVAREYFYNEDMLAINGAIGVKKSIWIDELKGKFFSSKEDAIADISEMDLEDSGANGKIQYEYWYIKEYKPW